MLSTEYTMLLGLRARMPKEDQDLIDAAVVEVKALVEKYGDHGLVALALVGAELGEK